MNETYFFQEGTGGTKYISRFGSQSTAAIETIVIQRKEWDRNEWKGLTEEERRNLEESMNITNPEKRKKVLTTLLENVNAKLAELQDRKELLEHELSLLNGV